MAVASAAKMVLLSGNRLVKWRQVVSPFWKWQLITAAAPTLSFILEPSVKTLSCDPRVSRNSLNLAWASGLEIMHLFTPSKRLCLFRLCVPGGKLGILKGQTNLASSSAEAMAASTLRPMGWVGGRVMPPLPFSLGTYKSLVIRLNSCRAWRAGLLMQARVFK